MNQNKSQHILLHPPSRYERKCILWLIKFDAKGNATSLGRSTYSQNIQGNQTTQADNEDEQMKKNLLLHLVPLATQLKTNSRR